MLFPLKVIKVEDLLLWFHVPPIRRTGSSVDGTLHLGPGTENWYWDYDGGVHPRVVYKLLDLIHPGVYSLFFFFLPRFHPRGQVEL